MSLALGLLLKSTTWQLRIQITLQDPMHELNTVVSGSLLKHMPIRCKNYSYNKLTSFIDVLTSYSDHLLKNGLIPMTVPRIWFLFSVPFSPNQVKYEGKIKYKQISARWIIFYSSVSWVICVVSIWILPPGLVDQQSVTLYARCTGEVTLYYDYMNWFNRPETEFDHE